MLGFLLLLLLLFLLFKSGEFLLHIPCWLHIYEGNFSYTSRAGFFFSFFFLSFFFFCLGNFFYTFHACLSFLWGVSLTHPMLGFLLLLLLLFLLFKCGEFLLHIPCWLHIYEGNFSYTSRAGFFLLLLSGEFLLHIPCLLEFSVGIFSYTTHAGFFFFFFNLGNFSYTSHAGFIFMRGVSLTHTVLCLFFCGEFLLHIPCLLDFSVGSFSYTSHAGCFCFCFLFCLF